MLLYGVFVLPTADEPEAGRTRQTQAEAPPIVAVCSGRPYSDAPAGPALRAVGFARGLASHGLDIVLVAPAGSRASDGATSRHSRDRTDRRAGRDHDRVRVSPRALSGPRRCHASRRRRSRAVPAREPRRPRDTAARRRRRVLIDEAPVLARLLASADLVLCAHDRQRDLTLGMMLASGALRPELIDADPGLAQLFMTVPFGPTGAVRRLTPRAAAGRLHVVWPGGLWDWLDPVCLVEAIADARARGTEVTAELWGARSPDPLVPPSRAAAQVAERARQLGVEDVVEIVGWVPHAERRASTRLGRCGRHARPGRDRGTLRLPHAARRRARIRASDHRDRGRVRRGRGGEARRRIHRTTGRPAGARRSPAGSSRASRPDSTRHAHRRPAWQRAGRTSGPSSRSRPGVARRGVRGRGPRARPAHAPGSGPGAGCANGARGSARLELLDERP